MKKPRNIFAVLAKKRKAGSHTKTNKQQRKHENDELRKACY